MCIRSGWNVVGLGWMVYLLKDMQRRGEAKISYMHESKAHTSG